MTADRPGVLPSTGTAGARADDVVELGDLGTWRPKLVASDLDGTLLTSDGEVSPRTRAALTACWDAGIPVVGVTGRGPRLLDSVRVALDGRGIAVTGRGSLLPEGEPPGSRTDQIALGNYKKHCLHQTNFCQEPSRGEPAQP